MERKRSKKNRIYTRVERLKKRKRKFILIMITISSLVFVFISGTILKNTYLSYKCQDLSYAIDYYFTHNSDSSLRINYVQSISFIDKNTTSATIEVLGLSPTEPPERTTLIGNLLKDDGGSWVLSSISKKD